VRIINLIMNFSPNTGAALLQPQQARGLSGEIVDDDVHAESDMVWDELDNL
jgi:hypothetical protein